MQIIKTITFCLIFYLFLLACAQQQPLTGGLKDEQPPKMDLTLSSLNNQTNFQKQKLEFVFDEYIQLQNVLKQVVISPPLERIPKITTKLKKLIFEFPEEEVLKEGATYSINFGDAVKDFTEGNTVADFKFIFSTGSFIDSLKLKGTIVDALTGEPVQNALYMLYDNLADSVVYTQKPFYFGKSDKAGNFFIENIKAGQYKGFALEDQDLNYLYNIPTERIGFSLDTIFITDSDDTSSQVVNVSLFEPYTLVAKPKANVKIYGMVPIVFKRNPFDASVELENVGQASFVETVGDTIKVWYHNKDSVDWNIFVYRDTFIDTIAVKALPKNLEQQKLTVLTKPQARGAISLININPLQSIKLVFNHPVQQLDTSLIFLREDSVDIKQTIDTFNLSLDTSVIQSNTIVNFIQATYTRDSLAQRTIVIQYPWKEQLKYQLQLLPGAVTDLYGLSNTDTIQLDYLAKERKDFGNIKLNITGMDSLQQYYCELLFSNEIVEAFNIAAAKNYQRTFTALPIGKYAVKIVQDINGNGRWDSGSYEKQSQPEKISTATLEELKANWDIEANVQVEF